MKLSRKTIVSRILSIMMIMSLSAVMCMAESYVTNASEATTASVEKGSVVLSVEKFTIGQGFVVEPLIVKFSGETTVAEIFDIVMREKGIEYTCIGTTKEGFYLDTIHNTDNGNINIPKAISDMEPYNQFWISPDSFVYAPSNEKNDGNEKNPDLGTMSYGSLAKWMYTVNGVSGNCASTMTVKDGDVIRFQFSVYGMGADIGIGSGIPSNVNLPDKELLIKLLAYANEEKYLSYMPCKQAYEKALDVVASYEVSGEDIAKVMSELSIEMVEAIKESQTTLQPVTEVPTTEKVTTAQPVINVKVGKTSVKKAQNVKGKKAKITLNKVEGAKGYQIKYSTSSKFKKAKTVTVKKLTYTIKKLQKKKYYVKARAYVIVNDKRVYGEWSKSKKVKIRK